MQDANKVKPAASGLTDRQALEKVVAAWESLPSGKHTSADVEAWLCGPMFRAIKAARKTLKAKRWH